MWKFAGWKDIFYREPDAAKALTFFQFETFVGRSAGVAAEVFKYSFLKDETGRWNHHETVRNSGFLHDQHRRAIKENEGHLRRVHNCFFGYNLDVFTVLCYPSK